MGGVGIERKMEKKLIGKQRLGDWVIDTTTKEGVKNNYILPFVYLYTQCTQPLLAIRKHRDL